MKERVVIVGGGVTGLSAAGFLANDADCILIEREQELGGYCRTIYKDGFTWDYSGHFFHFKDAWIARYLHARMDETEICAITKISRIYFRDQYIDFPFQFNIHQLPVTDFLRCLSEIYEAQSSPAKRYHSFQEMLYARYGKSLSDFFLIPYTEKLYATSATLLDPDCMGRFFPHIEFRDLMSHLSKKAMQSTYNDTFYYHRRGAKAYIDALASYVPKSIIRTGLNCEAINLDRQMIQAGGDSYHYDRLIITAPLPDVLRQAGLADDKIYKANKVLVLNLGFDLPSRRPDHWVYYPSPEWVFYRVGHYDNILGQSRMSLYVEIALASDTIVNVDYYLKRTLEDLRRCRVVADHRLISWASVIMNPAYVHISRASKEAAAKARSNLARKNVFAIGRYGEWTYCSIEDNIRAAYHLTCSWNSSGSTA